MDHLIKQAIKSRRSPSRPLPTGLELRQMAEEVSQKIYTPEDMLRLKALGEMHQEARAHAASTALRA